MVSLIIFLLHVSVWGAGVAGEVEKYAPEPSQTPDNGVTNGHEDASHEILNTSSRQHLRYYVASIDFQHVADPFIIALWLLLASLAKIGECILF